MMKNRLFFLIATPLLLALNACSHKEEYEPAEKQLVTNAGVREAGRKVNPGDTIHLYGEGFQTGDYVTLDFRWDTGDPSFPEGSIVGSYAKIIEAKPNGISFLMPYRKPESRVRIILHRAADRMTLGELSVADGQTPKDFRLYGVNPGRNTIETVWTQSKGNAATKWDMSAHPDFHSIVNLEKTYGLCGLAKADGVQQPFFFDFCTGEWSPLNPSFNTLSLAVTNTGYFVSIQEKAPGKYNLSTSLRQPEQSNYATRTSVVEKLPSFELPAGLSARQFGTYAGVFDPESGTVFLSADKGAGKWVPVLFHIRKGFRVLDEIEAEALIPFSFSVPGDKSQPRLAGYVISSPSAKGGSRFCLLDKESPHLQEPFATQPGKVVSITCRTDRPGRFTVLTITNGKTSVAEYNGADKTWSSLPDLPDLSPYTSVTWAN